MATKVILDCDTGTDDAVAVMVAALHPDLELLGVTTVWGNHDVEHTTDNTLRVLDHIGRGSVPVHRGRNEPYRPRIEALPSGRPELEPTLRLPQATSRPASEDAVGWLADTLRSTDGVTLVATGPLTNLAHALEEAPDVVARVERLVVLGGTHEHPGVTEHAERNVWCDPHAAQRVLTAGWGDVLLVTMDATFAAPLTAGHAELLRTKGTPAGTAAADFVDERIRVYGTDSAPLHDPLAVGCLVDEALLARTPASVAVELEDPERYGATYLHLESRDPTLTVALDADLERYVDLLCDTL